MWIFQYTFNILLVHSPNSPMNHIYKILLILILIITITIYFYTNRYEIHVADNTYLSARIIMINKWTGKTFLCCKLEQPKEWVWKYLGIPKEPTTTFIRLDEPIEPTPTN